MTVNDWRDDAACIGRGHLFHAPEGEQYHARAKREAAALALCQTCPVLTECARLVMTDRDIYTHAVAAGTTPADRGIRVGGGSRIPARTGHGTAHGLKGHIRDGEDPCDACAEYDRIRKLPRRERDALRKKATA